MSHTLIAAADALKLFRGRGIEVQTAKPVKLKGDDGAERDGFKTANVPLREEHILSAKLWANGETSITTIDGQRYVATGKVEETAKA